MPTYMTRDTLDRLQKRLQEIQKEKYEVARELQVAAAQGDLSENAEYEAAKEKKDMLAHEEIRTRDWLGDASLIEELSLPEDVVTIGKKVKIKDLQSEEEMEFVVLGELDKWEGIEVLSATAPLAKGLLSKKKGRSVEVQLPRGSRRFKILEVDDFFRNGN